MAFSRDRLWEHIEWIWHHRLCTPGRDPYDHHFVRGCPRKHGLQMCAISSKEFNSAMASSKGDLTQAVTISRCCLLSHCCCEPHTGGLGSYNWPFKSSRS